VTFTFSFLFLFLIRQPKNFMSSSKITQRLSYFIGCTAILPFLFSSCSKNSAPPKPILQDTTKTWIVSTLAGTGHAGFVDSIGPFAQFNRPQCIAVDDLGNVYVGDVNNYAIRKIDSSGIVSTYAGKTIANPGFGWGNIYGMAFDEQNNLFIVEYDLVARISSPTNILDFAGSMSVDYIDAQGTSAAFNMIANMTIDAHGNLFLPDYDKNYHAQIRKITPTGEVSTLALNDSSGYSGDPTTSNFYLYAIAADPSGNLYMTTDYNQKIKKIDPQGNATLFANTIQFDNILGMATDPSGNLWVVDAGRNAILKITPGGTAATILGELGTGLEQDGDSSRATFYQPAGIAVGKNGIVYVADNGINKIRKIEYK